MCGINGEGKGSRTVLAQLSLLLLQPFGGGMLPLNSQFVVESSEDKFSEDRNCNSDLDLELDL